jgi:hypothetical protein
MTDTACLAWKYKNQLPFEGGFTNKNNPLCFYLMTRCRDEIVHGEKICAKCLQKKNKEGCTGPGLYWGLVTEPIRNFEKLGKEGKALKERTNHMAFSPYFLENIKRYGISTENLQKARDAWIRAVAGLNEIPPLPDMGDKVETAPKKKVAKAKVVKNLKSAAALPHVVTVPVVTVPVVTVPVVSQPDVIVPPPAHVKKYYKKKVAMVTPVAILSNEKPVEVEVETINVVVRELNGTRYYVDTSKSKVYDVKNGSYIGRWDTVTEKLITSLPDSDAETGGE